MLQKSDCFEPGLLANPETVLLEPILEKTQKYCASADSIALVSFLEKSAFEKDIESAILGSAKNCPEVAKQVHGWAHNLQG